jgi:hypothetical protein
MKSEKRRDFFWLSYSDLMTSLFFVMLVLFVLVYSIQQNIIGELKVYKEEYLRIKEIEKTVNNIDTNLFYYDRVTKKHILNVNFLFPTGVSDINKIYPDKTKELIDAGFAIKGLVLRFPDSLNIKYCVVIEGQASKDSWVGNDDLSFQRAQALVNLWKKAKIGLENLPNLELVIAGSGEKGVPRKLPDKPPANQRFLITIIPKIGKK